MRRFTIAIAVTLATSVASAQQQVDFARDIRPILSNHCFKCHGPDATHREAELRLDQEESVRSPRDGRKLLDAGLPEQSEVFVRVNSSDADLQMPPPDEERQLTRNQIQLIRDWIKQGAQWESHWAFRIPQRHALPQVKQSDWSQNEIDHFVLRRLEQQGLRHSEPASKRTLIRRVTLDLTGLPPTPEEVDAFLADESAQAFEKVVDRLLQSPRYGEHMAGDWLDAARYADTSGYQNDGPREMWRWRDWVIDAFNSNMPFDQFTVEQLAGDLLENPTLPQRIATGFNRNHRGNAEGGIIPDEFQVEYVVDRVETTSTVWLGLTMGCARCHEHKYDPFTQKEFYQIYALFNNIPEHGRAIKEGNSPPYIQAPTEQQKQQLQKLEQRSARLAGAIEKAKRQVVEELRKWEESKPDTVSEWKLTDGLLASYDFDDDLPKTIDGEPKFVDRLGRRAVQLNGKTHLDAGDVANFGYFDKFSLTCWIRPNNPKANGTLLSQMEDVPRGSGYSVQLVDGKIEVDLVKRWLDDSIRVETVDAIVPPEQWTHLVVTYDGSRVASGIRIYINGELQSKKVNLDYINQSFAATEAPFRIGAGHGEGGRFAGSIDDVQIYDRVLGKSEVLIESEPVSIASILQIPKQERSYRQSSKLFYWFLQKHASADLQKLFLDERHALRELQQFQESLPTVMVMQELEIRRKTFVLNRGEYDKPTEQVFPGLPEALADQSISINNRLDFARWIVSAENPLTARVVVNRLWQQMFGVGLVKTTEDFGSQGELPTHPLLLDWLATELIRLDWDIQALQKMIVLSATYQQSSAVSSDLRQQDPENRLLARGPRIRLSARMLRDQALFVSGLLHEQLGGPSVFPYQPEGLWKEIATTTNYVQSTGTDLYRRSLYTYWKRTVAPPNMAIFDAAGREMCVVRSSRTNTPLQALATMNDVTFLEAARVLAERSLGETESVAESIKNCFVRVTSRPPEMDEQVLLQQAYDYHLKNYRKNQAAAHDIISHGASTPEATLGEPELAAMTIVAATILNLDEVITKE